MGTHTQKEKQKQNNASWECLEKKPDKLISSYE